MKILKSIAVAFSMYSRIPMPKFNWESEDMKYHLIFFPWIGAIIGGLEFAWMLCCDKFHIEHFVFTIIAVVIPLMVTGGFHLDGYMDTSDALASWQDREKRLEILKDSHIGAFAVIKLCVFGLVLISAVYSMDNMAFITWLFLFFEARTISGICVVTNKKAKKEGLLHTEARTANDKVVLFCLAGEFIMVCAFAGFYFQWYWTASLGALLVSVIYYLYTAYTKFGGITGDLAGWFVCNAEVLGAVALAVMSIAKK